MVTTELRMTYTVFIIDDDQSVRDSLSLVLSLQGFRTASFVSAEDFLAALKVDWMGCVVTDLKMPGMNGLQLQEQLAAHHPTLPIIFITAHGDINSARTAFKAAAIDFLEKPFDDRQIVAAIDLAIARQHSRQLSVAEQQRRSEALVSLTAREQQVMVLLSEGLRIREVGDKLGLSPRTIEVYKARILAKLGIRNTAELVRLLSASP